MTIDLSVLHNLVAAAPKRLAVPSHKTWFNVQNHADGPAAVYLHNEIGAYGITSADFASEISGLGDFELHINSVGGNVWEGLAIYATIQQHPGVVSGVVDALAASAASVIACGCSTLKMAKNARLMVHDAAVGYGEVQGNADELRDFIAEIKKAADFLDDTSDNIADIYADKAGGDRKKWRAIMKKETWYSAEDAIKAKLADGIVGDTGPTNSAVSGLLAPVLDPHSPDVPAPTNPENDLDGFRNALKGVLA